MKKFYVLFLCLICSFTWAQQAKIDSLKSELNKNHPVHNKILILENICSLSENSLSIKNSQVYFDQLIKLTTKEKNWTKLSETYQLLAEIHKKNRDLNKSLEFIELSILINKKNKNYNLLSKDYTIYGTIYYYFQKFNEANKQYLKAIELCKKEGYYKQLAYTYFNYSSSLASQNKDIESINLILKAIDLAEKHKLPTLLIQTSTNLGASYLKIQQHLKAEEYLLYALQKEEEESQTIDLKIKCDIYRFLGLNYSRWEKYNKAIKYNDLALKCYQSTNSPLIVSDILNTIGSTHLRLEQFKEALPYFKKLIIKSKQLKSQIGINFAQINMSSALINLEKLDEAEQILLKSLKDTLNVAYFPKRIEAIAYQNLSVLYEIKKKYKLALFFQKKQSNLETILIKENKSKEITNIETKYQTEKKEKENIQLKAAKETQTIIAAKATQQKWFFGIAFLISLCILSILGYYYKQNQAQKNLIENLQKELHHRVKNNLAIIDSLIEDIKDNFENPLFESKLTALQNRISSINEIHAQLYQSKDIANLNLKNYVAKLAENITNSYDQKDIKITQNITDDIYMSVEKSFPLGMIINEFVTNSYKYAFDNKKGNVIIDIQESTNSYELTLSDNGKGLPQNFDIANLTSFGMDVMQLLSKQLKGSFKLDGTNGLTLNIEFPKN
ncbi:MAG: hypothetical protein COB60_02045 [Flavobacteriaceae bacterium]|nr:MAG: hypothetical protein COB60_02045 [Flavobacteriaceae bacterium]